LSSVHNTIERIGFSLIAVRRVTATEDEKENAMEYGLPSSHALNTVCLMGYVPALISIREV